MYVGNIFLLVALDSNKFASLMVALSLYYNNNNTLYYYIPNLYTWLFYT